MESLLNWINLFVCGAGAVICICRLGNMEGEKPTVHMHYGMWLVVLSASALSPAWWPVSVFQLAFGCCVLAQLILGYIAIQTEKNPYTRAPSTPA